MKGFWGSICSLFAGAGLALAQEGTPPASLPPEPTSSPEVLVYNGPSYTGWTARPCCGPRAWASAEYLLWRMKDGATTGPLVVSDTTGAIPAVGSPGMRVLYGDSDFDYETFSGARFGAGFWLRSSSLGVEASVFQLERRAITFNGSSNATGNPVLAIPFFDLLGNPAANPIAVPGVASGSFTLSSSSRLWGAESNFVFKLRDNGARHVDLLCGFKFLDLDEDLETRTGIGLVGTPVNGAFFDRFQTGNQFYGGQLGVRVSTHRGRLSADGTCLVALGSTRQTTTITGGNAVVGGGFATIPNGIFTGPGNIGTYTNNEFSAVPQVQLKLGYDVSRSLRATVGYDFLYWSNVIRPTEQVDRAFNFPTATVRPEFPNHRTDIWAQGVSFGMEFRW